MQRELQQRQMSSASPLWLTTPEIPSLCYISGPSNPLTDASSCLFHLSDTSFLSAMNSLYPQKTCFQLLHLEPKVTFSIAETAVENGVSTGRARSTTSAWTKPKCFSLELALDPLFQTFTHKVPLLQVFVQHLQEGKMTTHFGILCLKLGNYLDI